MTEFDEESSFRNFNECITEYNLLVDEYNELNDQNSYLEDAKINLKNKLSESRSSYKNLEANQKEAAKSNKKLEAENSYLTNQLDGTIFYNNILMCFCLAIIILAGVRVRSVKKSEKETRNQLKDERNKIMDLERKLEELVTKKTIPEKVKTDTLQREQPQLDLNESDSQKFIDRNTGNFKSTSRKRGYSLWFSHKTVNVSSEKTKPSKLFSKFLGGMVPSTIKEFKSSSGDYVLTPEIQKYCFLKVRKRSNASKKYVKPKDSSYRGKLENYLPYRPFIQKLMADPELHWLIKYYHDESRCPLEKFITNKSDLDNNLGENHDKSITQRVSTNA